MSLKLNCQKQFHPDVLSVQLPPTQTALRVGHDIERISYTSCYSYSSTDGSSIKWTSLPWPDIYLLKSFYPFWAGRLPLPVGVVCVCVCVHFSCHHRNDKKKKKKRDWGRYFIISLPAWIGFNGSSSISFFFCSIPARKNNSTRLAHTISKKRGEHSPYRLHNIDCIYV